ncbi:MAG: AI-2E family transporter [Ferruginibacter sp.]
MQKSYPFYLKSTVILFGLILFVYALSNLKDIFVPLAFAMLLAILLNPLQTWFRKRSVPQVWSIVLSLFIAIIVIAAVVYFLSSQFIHFGDQLPALKQKFAQLFTQFQQWLQENTMLNMQRQQKIIGDLKQEVNPLIGQTLGTMVGTLSIVVLLPVYTFLFLYYKTLILNFLFEVFAEKNSKEVSTVLSETKKAVQSYMVGLLLEALIVAILNILALWLLGVKYALLLGFMGALLNMIPYLGGIIAILLPVMIATVTKDGFNTQIGIVVAYSVIQFVDNHFIIPLVVSSKVRINAMISIVVVLLGNALWGIPGMFLSVPFTGVLKIIFDRVPDLKPWGRLLGDEIPVRHKGQRWFKNTRKKAAVTEKKSE